MRKLIANPAEMIAHGAPRLIHNDQELAAYTDALFELTALDQPSRSQVEAIELLTLLVEYRVSLRNEIRRGKTTPFALRIGHRRSLHYAPLRSR
jgi:hypothetical protein